MVLRQMVLNFFEKSDKQFQTVSTNSKKSSDGIWTIFKVSNKINQILQQQYQMHREAVQLVFWL